jgi:hypothetical protein
LDHRHCERSEAILIHKLDYPNTICYHSDGLLRRFTPRNDPANLFLITIIQLQCKKEPIQNFKRSTWNVIFQDTSKGY